MKKRNSKNISSKLSTLFYLPIYLIVALIPHLYYYIKFSFSDTENQLFLNSAANDLYVLIKARALFLFILVAVALFFYGVIDKRIKLKWDFFSKLTIITCAIIIVASFLSKYQDLVYFGGRERFEGLFVYLAYIVLVFIGRVYSKDRKFLIGIINSILYSSFVMSIIGIAQTLGYDIYTASPLKWIIFPKEIAKNIETLVRVDIDYGAVASLYHSNYFGVFMVMGAVVAILNVLNDKDRIKNLVFSLFLIFGVIASASEASMFAFAVVISVMFYLKFDEIKENYKYIAIIAVGFVLEIFIVSSYYRLEFGKQKYFYILLILGSIIGGLFSKLRNKYYKTKSYNLVIIVLIFAALFATPVVGMLSIKAESPVVKFEKFDIDGNVLTMKTEDMKSDLVMTFSPEIFKTNKDENARAEIDYEKNIITIYRDDKAFSFIMEYYDEGKYFIKFLGYNIILRYEDEELYYANYRGDIVADNNSNVKKIDFLADNGFQFSARGYIWSRFIPLTFESPLIGYGPDAYPYIFPQTEYIEKYNLYGNAKMIVDKPHSIYLDWILNFGYLGFIAIMTLIGSALYYGISKMRTFDIYGVLIMLAVLSSGIFNDSIIGISQIFFLVLGVTAGDYVEKVEG